MIDLSVEFVGLSLPNPFIVGSGPTTGNPEKIIKAIKAGWGSVVVKTIGDSIVRKAVRPMYGVFKRGRDLVAFENLELITEDPLEAWDKYLKVIKSEVKNPIIVSIMGGSDYDEWVKLARWVEERGAGAVELNFGCPHGEPERKTGAFIGQHPDLVFQYTKEVVRAVGIPVVVKLTPNVTDISEIAKAAELAGAKGVTAINTVNGVIGVDIERGTPLPDVNGYTTYGGISGPAIKPIGLAAVSKVRTSTQLEISGVGGIFDWRDGVEYMMLGASTVQSVTYTMIKGFDFVREWEKELVSFLERKGYSSVRDLIGIASSKITSYEFLEKVTKRRTSVDEEITSVRGEVYG
ncbi:NAD-dependent dihydropyrimidine dehydrogenase subunit PreA [Stygiolobus caldivivus]|uniref:Dihydroorotate dehydrogenase B (NAD(+)), catalytic subunit n=1 Tax=Stygiolobus caldivivus TaxID=2824673 RepID=A0A8D5ZKR6_9CREN|nr:NAD-dependent dihydropyrimidine dehydrogenase subunit PreA [Stygiolobus caldivivus]BCU71655.1 dihydropyrimidine dehydrogenase [Stygiolobus caldivivus]